MSTKKLPPSRTRIVPEPQKYTSRLTCSPSLSARLTTVLERDPADTPAGSGPRAISPIHQGEAPRVDAKAPPTAARGTLTARRPGLNGHPTGMSHATPRGTPKPASPTESDRHEERQDPEDRHPHAEEDPVAGAHPEPRRGRSLQAGRRRAEDRPQEGAGPQAHALHRAVRAVDRHDTAGGDTRHRHEARRTGGAVRPETPIPSGPVRRLEGGGKDGLRGLGWPVRCSGRTACRCAGRLPMTGDGGVGWRSSGSLAMRCRWARDGENSQSNGCWARTSSGLPIWRRTCRRVHCGR